MEENIIQILEYQIKTIKSTLKILKRELNEDDYDEDDEEYDD